MRENVREKKVREKGRGCAHVCVEEGEGNGKGVKNREKGMVMWAQV